jgi:hypothetical protein
MVATFAVLGVALDSQTDIVDTGREVADMGLKKQQEDFIITQVEQIPTESLSIGAKNNGQNPTEIFTLIMTNSSDIANGYPTRTFEIPSDTSFLSPGTDVSTDIVETLDIKMKTPETGKTDHYKFKVISSLGTIKTFNLVCYDSGLCDQGISGGGGSGDLAVQLFLDGPNGINTKTSTVVMFVSNIGDGKLKEIWPDKDCGDTGFPSITHAPPSDNLGNFTSCELTPPASTDSECNDGVPPPDTTGVCLGPGQTMIFKWDGTVSGDVGDEFNFCNSVSGKQLDNSPVFSNTDCDDLEVIDPNDCGGCEGGGGDTIILIDDLLIRPALYMIIPSPFGSMGNSPQDYEGLWGVNIVNPTEKPMNVSKVTIVSYPPASNDNVNLIVKGCDMTMISPTSDWSCPRANTIMWQNQLSPLPIDAYSSRPFLVTVEPGDITGKDDIDALIVQANAFTTTGSFGKSDYQSTMSDAKDVIANVYLTSTLESRTDIQSQRLTLIENQTATFNVTLADMDNFDDTYIKEGAKLIVNVPRDWTEVCITSSTGFDANTSGDPDPCVDNRITEFNDGSTQIIVVTSSDLGGTSPPSDEVDARSISFTAKPPMNEIPNAPRPYIMYVLADGLSGNNFQIGPLNEIALVVQPTP